MTRHLVARRRREPDLPPIEHNRCDGCAHRGGTYYTVRDHQLLRFCLECWQWDTRAQFNQLTTETEED